MDPCPADAPADGSKSGGSRAPPPPPADGRSKRGRSPADAPADRRSKRGRSRAPPPPLAVAPADGSKRGGSRAPPPRPADGSPRVAFCRWLGHSGIILVLFETPSGFAVLHYDGSNLFRPNALENIWSKFIDLSTARDAVLLKEFKIFTDKTSAINSDGVSSELAKMINRSLRPGQKLAVAKKEYKDIIEKSLGIDCLFDRAVLEVMWGLKNLIKVLVPDEKLELTNEDRSQISVGMNAVLRRHGVEADANLVNSDIIDMASTVYECDRLVGARDALLQHYGKRLLEVSEIDSSNWDQLKLATALKLVCYPEEENVTSDPEEENVTGDPEEENVTGDHEEENVTGDHEEENVTGDHEEENVTGDHEELLSETEAKKLMEDAALYEDKFDKRTCLDMYQNIVWASGIRHRALVQLRSMVKEAKNGLKLHQGSSMVGEAKNGLKLHQGGIHGQGGTTIIEAAP